MTSEQTFLSALTATPDDELTWLALADWLEESDQPDRAELVRAWRRLRGMKRSARGRAALEAQLCDLLAKGTRPIVP